MSRRTDVAGAFNAANYYTKTQSDQRFMTPSAARLAFQPIGNYAPLNHNHDDIYYTKTQSDNTFAKKTDIPINVVTSAQLANFYTKTDTDNTFAKKTDIPTNVVTSTQLANFYTKTDTDNTFAKKTDIPTNVVTSTQLANFYTKTESDGKFAPLAHNHDASYYTKQQVDTAVNNARAKGVQSFVLNGSTLKITLLDNSSFDVILPVTPQSVRNVSFNTSTNSLEVTAADNTVSRYSIPLATTNSTAGTFNTLNATTGTFITTNTNTLNAQNATFGNVNAQNINIPGSINVTGAVNSGYVNLRGNQHYLAYMPAPVDGPRLQGWNGGQLGIPGNATALSWNSDLDVRMGRDLAVTRNATVNGGITTGSLNITGNTNIDGALLISGRPLHHFVAAPIRTRNVSYCMDVANNSNADGTDIRSWECNSSPAQEFIYNPQSRQIIHKSSGKCVSIPNGNTENGTRLRLFQCQPSETAQQFNLELNRDGYRYRSNLDQSKCIDYPQGNPTLKIPMEIRSCTSVDGLFK